MEKRRLTFNNCAIGEIVLHYNKKCCKCPELTSNNSHIDAITFLRDGKGFSITDRLNTGSAMNSNENHKKTSLIKTVVSGGIFAIFAFIFFKHLLKRYRRYFFNPSFH